MTEKEIIDRIISGDTEKYSWIVNTYSKLCFSVAYRITNVADDAQDIVQDAFISAYENLKSFKAESKFSTWLYRIVMNKALAAKNKTKYFEEVENQSISQEEYDVEIDKNVVKNAQMALNALNEKERLITELFYYQEQSIKEIAQICQSSEPNVKVMLHRARKKMNETLSKSSKFAINE